MPNPCEQSDNITNIHKTLERMEQAHETDRLERRESEKRLMDILERMADQGARLEHMEEHAEETARNTATLYERVRDLELNYAHADGPAVRQRLNDSIDGVTRRLDSFSPKLDKLNRFYALTTHKYALISYGIVVAMIVTGTLLDFMYHRDTFMAIVHFFKG